MPLCRPEMRIRWTHRNLPPLSIRDSLGGGGQIFPCFTVLHISGTSATNVFQYFSPFLYQSMNLEASGSPRILPVLTIFSAISHHIDLHTVKEGLPLYFSICFSCFFCTKITKRVDCSVVCRVFLNCRRKEIFSKILSLFCITPQFW